MAPIAGRDGLLEAATTQNVLDAKGDQYRVLAVVIKRIAAGDALDDQPGRFVQGVGDTRLLIAIDPAIGLREVPTKRIG